MMYIKFNAVVIPYLIIFTALYVNSLELAEK